MSTDLLVIGGSGFIGARTVQAALRSGYTAACTIYSRPAPPEAAACRLDVHDTPSLLRCLETFRPKTVIYSVLSWDLSSLDAQMRSSADGLRAVIAAMRQTGLNSRLVYISTNAVFSGNRGPYAENDVPDPENRTDAYRYYGLARRAGEEIALSEWPDAVVARTANVDGYDAWGVINKRLEALINPLRLNQPLPRFVDRVISPTLVDNLADALVEVALPSFSKPSAGILHLAGREPVTDYEYARRLAVYLDRDPDLVREDHYLPPGTSGIYSIGLDVAYSQTLLRTRLLNIDEMLSMIFHKK